MTDWPPFVTDIGNKTTEGDTFARYEPKGAYISILEVLMRDLNFSVVYHHPRKRSWSIMLEQVASGEVDMVATGNSHTLARSLRVDFSHTLQLTTLRMFYSVSGATKKPGDWLVYLRSYRKDTWVAVVSYIILGIITISTLSLAIHSRSEGKKDSLFSSFSSSLMISSAFLVMSSLGRRFPKEPSYISLRIIFFGISFCGFVMISLYRAMLGASLAIKISKPPVSSLADLLRDDHNYR